MRVALLCPYSLSRPGGVQGQVTGLAGALRTAGHEAVVLAPVDGPVELPELGTGSFVALGRSVAIPANGSLAPVALSPGAAARAVRAVRRGGFDVLHLHEPLAPGPGYACLVAGNLPKVGTFHRSGAGIAYRLLGPVARLGAARLAARCAVSEAARSTAQRVLGGTYEIVGNGVDLARFANVAPWPTTGPTVLFVGRHERRKGLEVLLGVLDALEARGGDRAPTVWVTGEGPETGRLRPRHAGAHNVEWLGRVGDDELAARLAGADILCAPSLGGESFGIVLLEAMAARTAVVASDLPGYAEVARHHAVLVPPGDQAALGRALDQAVSDAARRTGICAPEALDAAYAHAAQWSMTTIAARYVALYQRVMVVQPPSR